MWNKIPVLVTSFCIAFCCFCSESMAITNYTGWWWEGEEFTGTGVSIEDQGNFIYLAWYGYDSARPFWYSAYINKNGAVYQGSLARYTGWSLELNQPEDGFAGTNVGTVSLSFASANEATLAYRISGKDYTKTLTRYWSGQADPRLLHGWWYDPAAEGMGLFMEARQGRLFASWYHYREDHSPRWWISIGDFPGHATEFSEPLLEFSSGQNLTGEYKTPVFNAERGQANLEFINESRATLEWQGFTYNLQRFTFASQDKPCFASTSDAKYPTIVVYGEEALAMNAAAGEAVWCDSQGRGFWCRHEGEGVGARTTAYYDNHLVIMVLIAESLANVAIIGPDGEYSIDQGLQLPSSFRKGERISGSQIDALSRIAGAVGSLACLTAAATEFDLKVSDAVHAIAAGCESPILRKVSRADAENDFGTAYTLVNVAACGDEPYGNTCPDSLAHAAAVSRNQYEIFANANFEAIDQAQDEIGDQDCQKTFFLPKTIEGTWVDACPSTHRPGSLAKFYTFTLDHAHNVTIHLSSVPDSYLYLLQGAGAGGAVLAQDDNGGVGANARIETLLQAGAYTIEATTAAPGISAAFQLLATGADSRTVQSVWSFTYDWDCDGSRDTALWTLFTDHSFDSDEGETGAWSLTGNHFALVYDNQTTYTGELAGNIMAGTMVEDLSLGGDTGCWTATLTEGSLARDAEPREQGEDSASACRTCADK